MTASGLEMSARRRARSARAALVDLRVEIRHDDIAELGWASTVTAAFRMNGSSSSEGLPERVVVLRGCQRVELIQSRDRWRRFRGCKNAPRLRRRHASRAVTFQIQPALVRGCTQSASSRSRRSTHPAPWRGPPAGTANPLCHDRRPAERSRAWRGSKSPPASCDTAPGCAHPRRRRGANPTPPAAAPCSRR